MKNKKCTVWIVILLSCIILIIVTKEKKCKIDNCKNNRIKNGKYCIEHTCEVEGCTAQAGILMPICAYHFEEYLNNPSEETILTDSQIKKAKRAIEEYCKKLMDKQSNILAINLINNYPENVTDYSCSFRCNVVRKDEDVNLATIRLLIDEEGEFKVDNLIYDD